MINHSLRNRRKHAARKPSSRRRTSNSVGVPVPSEIVTPKPGADTIHEAIRVITGEWRAGADMCSSPSLLHAFIENSTAVIYVKDLDGRYVLANRHFETVLGLPIGSIIGKTDHELFPAESADRIRALDHRVLAERNALEGELVVVQHGGEAHTYIAKKFPLLDPVGKPYALCGISTDISSRKEAESALKDSERRYRALYESVPVMMHSIDRTGRLLSVSDAWLETLGFEREEVIGRHSSDFLTPESRKHAQEISLPKFLKTGVCANTPYQFVKKSGEVVDVLLSAVMERDNRGEMVRSLAVGVDVTERNRAMQALAESEARFRDYVDTASDWYWETGPDHRFTVNHGREQSRGIVHRSLLGKRRVDLAADVDYEPEKWAAHFAQLERHEPFREFVYRTTNRDGSIRHVSVSGKPVFDADGRFLGYRGSGRDVTEAVEAREALQRARTESEAANKAKSEFLANMSHEFRTPLNAILGFAQMLAQQALGPVGDPRYCGYAEDILHSGQHLLDLINDILDMSKIEAGKLELHEGPVDIAKAVEMCTRTIQSQAEQQGLSLVMAHEGPPPILYGDETRLRQIVLNLLSNAVKFTPSGGSITVRLARETDGSFAIAVSDTGIGMANEDIPIALAPFGQIDGQLNRKYEGTGLGLPLTKRLVELHGGSLRIDSVPGAGTTVTARFPRERLRLAEVGALGP
jgi:PAS domain S-box-containing protein